MSPVFRKHSDPHKLPFPCEKPEIRIPDHGILLVRKHPGLVPLALQHIGEKLLRPCIGKTSLFDPFHRWKIIRSHRTKNRLRLSRGLRLIATILCIFVVIIRIFMNIVYFHYILLFAALQPFPMIGPSASRPDRFAGKFLCIYRLPGTKVPAESYDAIFDS